MDGECSQPGCDRKINGRGLCATHYRRQRQGEDLSAPIKEKAKTLEKECVVPSCDRKPVAKNLCSAHYEAERIQERRNAGVTCDVDGCEKPPRAKGLCETHYGRLRRGKPIDQEFDPNAPRGPYKGRKGARPYEDRVRARSAEAPLCKCGCGERTRFNVSKGSYRVYLPGHYRKDAPYKHEDWLRQEYVDRGRTTEDIANACGVNRSQVLRFLRKFDIEVRSQAESLSLSGRSRGPNNPSWKGGTTPERQRLYKTREWKLLIQAVYERDGFRCVRCGHHQDHGEHALHAHHVATWAEAPEKRTDMGNLVTLCRACHTWVHSRGNEFGEFLERERRK